MSTPRSDAALREQAEAALRGQPAAPPSAARTTSMTPQELVHELRVHQVELEMQNDELRRAQAALEASRLRYFDLYELAPVGYCTVSSTGLILEANLTATQLLGLARGALKLQPIARFIAHDDRDAYHRFSRQRLAAADAGSFELRMCRPDGTSFWVQLQACVAAAEPAAPVLRLVLTDVTERREAAAALALAKEAAEAADRAKSSFLANMSHEIRTPMNAILGLSQVLLLRGATPEQSARLGKIRAAGRELMGLLDNVLDLSMLDAGNVRLERVPFDPQATLREACALVEPQALAKGLTLRTVAHDLPAQLLGDPARLVQALRNYLDNAVKFSRRGAIVLSGSVEACEGRDIVLRLSVQDEGEGVAVEQLPRLFEPFEQADLSSTRRHGGSGLGLAITRRLAELMGGQAGVHSRQGVGSTFWMTVRLQTPDAAAPPAPTPP